MTARTTVGPATDADLPAVRALIVEYCRWIDMDLAFQEIDAELDGLPGDYTPPGGLLLLARMDGTPVGVAAYRRLDDRACEMKRLYVQARARGQGLSRSLVMTLMAHAARAGYREMRLDTLPKMGAAQHLYESLGFRDIPPYYETPIEGTRFMARELGL